MSVSILHKTAEVGGVPIAYLEAGEGKTILFLHGAGGAPPAGACFVSMLADRHRLLLPSRPGFDDTPVGSCRALGDVTEVMGAFIRSTSTEKVHVVAQSAGGVIGCWLAILYPDLVASLVLSAPAAFVPPHAGPGSARPSPAELEKLLYGDHPSWTTPPSAEERQRIAANAQANTNRFAAPAGNVDLLARLDAIAQPTLLICAGDDRLIPAEALRPYQQQIRGCHRIFVHGAAHEIPISAAGPWVKLVGEFVDRGEYFLVNMDSSTADHPK